MSKVVDERVVSMQFDNKHFESNVKTTMSTLDKLKQKLNLSGASKGLESVNTAVKKVDMSRLGNAVETVRAKFSALEVMGVTALANITNSAVNAGKRFVSALTIEPIKDGFSEYEMTLNAVQTTMAGTGKTAEEVEQQLKKLDEYADKTVYSTADMLNNLPKFTNAGVELEKATTAMIGIANATALAGGDASKASIAFYNLGQAIGTGYLTRMDYNSINNAGIATMEWKEQMVEAAIAAGTLKKAGNDAYVAGKKTFTLQQLFIDGLQEQWATTDVMMKVFGDYGDEQTKIGKKAQAAAQDIKTFSQMMESLKATAGTGWKDTWQLIFGGLDEAKEFWTGLSEFISGIITKMADARNELIGNVLGSSWDKLTKKINKAGIATEDFTKALKKTAKKHGKDLDQMIKDEGSLNKVLEKGLISKELVIETIKDYAANLKGSSKSTEDMTDKLKYFQKVVDQVWNGDFKNGKERVEALTKAGYDYKTVQDLVNKTVDGHRLTLEDLSDAQLKNIGYTDEQITAIRKLAEEAEKTGTPLNELLDDLARPSGKDLLIETGKNLLEAISKPLKAVKEAWDKTFTGDKEQILYNVIDKINELSQALIMSDDSAENFKKVMEGVFAGFQVANWAIGGGLIAVLKIAGAVLSLFGTNLLEAGTIIADYIIKIRDWIKENTIFINSYDKIAKIIKAVIDGVNRCVKAFSSLKVVSKFIDKFNSKISELFGGFSLNDFSVDGIINKITNLFTKIENWIKGLDNTKDIGKYIIDGLINGLKKGVTAVGKAIWNIGKTIIESICNVLGIHSPSKVMIAIGAFIISGLLIGLTKNYDKVGEFLKNASTNIVTFVKNTATNIVNFIKGIDFGKLFTIAIGAGMFFVAKRIADALVMFGKAAEGFGELASGAGKLMSDLGDRINPKKNKFEAAANGILKLAIAIAILAASVYALAQLKPAQLWNAVGAIAALAVVIGILAFAINKIGQKSKVDKSVKTTVIEVGKISVLLLSLAGTMLLIAKAVKTLGSMGPDEVKQGMTAIIAIGIMVGALMWATKLAGPMIDKTGGTLLKISLTMLLLVTIIKMVSKLDEDALKKGAKVVLGFMGIIGLLVLMTKLAGPNIDGLGKTIYKMAAAILLLAFVARIIGGMDAKSLIKGAGMIVVFGIIIAGLVAITRLGGKDTVKIGGTILAVAAAMLVMALVVRILSGMNIKELGKGLLAVTVFGIIIMGLIASTKLAGSDLKGLAGTILAVSIAIAILASLTVILGLVKTEYLVKGILAVGLLSGMMAMLIIATKNAKDCKGNLIVLTVAITLMAVAIAALSLIDPSRLATATLSLSMVMGMFALLIYVSQYIKTGQKTWKRNLATLALLTVIVGALAGVIYLLAKCDPASALGAATSLSILLIAVSGALMIISKSKSMTPNNISKSLIMLVGLVGILAGLAAVIDMLKDCNPTSAIGGAIALSILLMSMSAVVGILSVIGPKASKSLTGVLALTLMAVPLVAFVGVLALMQNVNVVAGNVTALIALATAMTLLLIPLTIIGAFGMTGAPYLGVLALLTMAVPLVAFVGVLALMQNIQNAQNNATLLITLATAMTLLLIPLTIIGAFAVAALAGVLALTTMAIPLLAFVGILALMQNIQNATTNTMLLINLTRAISDILIKIAILGPLALIGIVAMQALTLLIIEIGALAVGVGALMEKFPSLEGFLNKGIPILIQIAGGIGEMIGAFVGGIISQLASGLPAIGDSLSLFMENVTPFINGAKLVDEQVLAGVGILAAAIIALTVADFINGLVSLSPLSSSLASLGTELSNFMINATPFIAGAMLINPNVMTGIKTLAEAILILTGANILEGIASWISGSSSLATFGSQLGGLGTNLNQFVTNLGTFTEDQVMTVDCAGRAIKALAKAAAEIPNEGGWAAKICGENSLATFGSYLPQLGLDLSSFVTNLGTFSKDQVTTVDCAGKAIKALAEAANEIPNEGGWAAKILGDNSLATFGSKLPQLGIDIKNFVTNLGTFGEDNIATVDCAGKAIKALAGAAKTIPNEGGLWAKIFGDNSLATFGKKLPDLAKDIKNFVTNLGTFGEGQIATVNSACEAIKVITGLGKIDLGDTSSGIEKLGMKLEGFAKKLSSFVDKMVEIGGENITTAITKTKDLIELAKTVAGTNVESLSTFGKSLKEVATKGVEGFVEAFAGKDPKAKVKEAAKDLLDAFINAAEGKEKSVTSAFKGIADAAADKVGSDSIKKKFKSAGKNLVKGFADGITAQTFEAKAAAKAMANKAYEAAKAELEVNSPSKVFRRLGTSVPEGFAMGIDKLGGMVSKSSEGMAKTAISTAKNSISRIVDVINSDMDTQPTIRPVLDLTNVRSGANAISGMFTGRRVLAVDANIAGLTSASMSQYQNGRHNNEVVSSIKALRKDIADMPRNTYNINGITYDDGSNISDAVKSLVRYAKIERRS